MKYIFDSLQKSFFSLFKININLLISFNYYHCVKIYLFFKPRISVLRKNLILNYSKKNNQNQISVTRGNELLINCHSLNYFHLLCKNCCEYNTIRVFIKSAIQLLGYMGLVVKYIIKYIIY